MNCTEKMKQYAKAISKELKIREPNYSNFNAVSHFISKNKDLYNKSCFKKSLPTREDYDFQKCSKDKLDFSRKLGDMLLLLYRKHGCYVLWSGKEIVYVGKSVNLGERILVSALERNRQKKITAVTPIITESEADAHILELVLINELKPILNNDSLGKDNSVFKSNISENALKRHRFVIDKLKDVKDFDFLTFGGNNER